MLHKEHLRRPSRKPGGLYVISAAYPVTRHRICGVETLQASRSDLHSLQARADPLPRRHPSAEEDYLPMFGMPSE